jgi:large subunit ribosomal protein L18
MAKLDRKARRTTVRRRIRKTVRGSAQTPRLAVHRTLKHIYCQAIDDDAGVTLAQASTVEKELRGQGGGGNVAAAQAVGKLIAARLKERGLDSVIFDRGGFLYHGRIKALADAAREGGLKF